MRYFKASRLSQQVLFPLWKQDVTPKRRNTFMILSVIVTDKNIGRDHVVLTYRNICLIKSIFPLEISPKISLRLTTKKVYAIKPEKLPC